MALLTALIIRLRDDQRGGFEIASSMAIAAFAIVAAAAIFLALTTAGEEIVQYMKEQIMGA
jgi:hypothetical protein